MIEAKSPQPIYSTFREPVALSFFLPAGYRPTSHPSSPESPWLLLTKFVVETGTTGGGMVAAVEGRRRNNPWLTTAGFGLMGVGGIGLSSELVACQSSPTAVAPREVAPISSPAVVETPTTAPTPTEAAPQEGDTYKDPVTGYEYTITVVRDSEGNEVYKGDFRPMTPIKIPTWDWTARWYGENGEIKSGKNVGNIDLYVDKNVPGADVITKITHVDVPEDYADYPPYLKTIYGKFTLNFGIGKDFKALFEGLQAGTIAYPFKVGSQEYTWYPSPDHGVIEYVLPYDAATMTEANGFNTWTDVPNTNEFVSKFVGIDPKGNMIWVMVSKTPLNELEDWEIRTMLNYPVATVLDSVNSDVSKKGDGPFLQSVVDDSAETNPPYTIIER